MVVRAVAVYHSLYGRINLSHNHLVKTHHANTILANNTFLHKQVPQSESSRALMIVVGDYVGVKRAVTEVIGTSVSCI